MKKLLLLVVMILSGTLTASHAPDKIKQEAGSFYVIAMPARELESLKFGTLKRVSVKLFKRFNNNTLSKEIGHANCTYFVATKRATLDYFKLDEKYRKQFLGSHVFKCTMAHLKKIFDCQVIEWNAFPLHDPTIENHKKLIDFYCKSGAIDIDGNKTSCTKMQYPIRAAAMLTVLLPILEPEPISKDKKQIILANGTKYASNPHDALGIIAQYMGNDTEINKGEVI